MFVLNDYSVYFQINYYKDPFKIDFSSLIFYEILDNYALI